jgi:hypothetical protein
MSLLLVFLCLVVQPVARRSGSQCLQLGLGIILGRLIVCPRALRRVVNAVARVLREGLASQGEQ